MRDNIKKYTDEFLTYVEKSNRFSPNTLAAYKNDLDKFVEFLREKGIRSIKKTNEKLALEYLDYLKGILGEKSVMRNISSLKTFFNYLKREGKFSRKNPFDNIKFRGLGPREIPTLTVKEVKKLTKVLRPSGFIESRDMALILFIYNTGLKATEASNALLKNLDLKNATYTCVAGGKKRVIPFSKSLIPVLEHYLEERKKLLKRVRIKNPAKKYLFINRRGGKITRQTVYIVVQKKADEARLNKNVTPSMLRNSLAMHLLSSGTREDIVKDIMGYATLVPKFPYLPEARRTRFEYLATHPAFKKR